MEAQSNKFSLSILQTFKRIISLARPQWKPLTVATFFLIIGAAMGLAFPQAIRIIIDGALENGLQSIDNAAYAMLVIFFVQGIAVAFRYYLFTVAGFRILTDLRADTFSQIMRQEVGFFDQRKTGELMSRLASDTMVLQNAVSVNISMVLRYGASTVGGIMLLFYTSPTLTLLMLLVVPPVVAAVIWMSRKIRHLSRQVQDSLAGAAEVAEETISGVRTVRSFTQEDYESERYKGSIFDAFIAMKKRSVTIALFQGGLSFVGYGAVALVLWYGGRLVVAEAMTIGDLTSFILYTLIVAFSLSALGGVFSDFVSAGGAADRVFELLDRVPAEGTEAGMGNRLPGVKGHLCLEGVHFAYPTRPDVAALTDIDLDIKPGELVALVGPSGSGKSTVAGLIPRFYEPQRGRITLDGVPIDELDPHWLRGQIGGVDQEPNLFSDSIAVNIRYGRLEASQEEIQQAAAAANAAEFIESFPDGYETEVGERGVRLSGGQKQRIAIARAVLKNPRILILDEATSALDAESEYLVKQALDRLMTGRTTLVIAHRLSTVRDADRVVVLDGGRIVESGPHAELMKAPDGLYRKLVERQFVELEA